MDEEIITLVRKIADRLGYDLVPRDPGPPEENEEFWSDAPCLDPSCQICRPRSDRALVTRAFRLDQ